MRRTKIVCTIGPASEDRETLAKLIDAGMNVARLNFSHGDHQEHQARIDLIRELAREKGRPVAILLDTKGPEIRTGMLENDQKVDLEAGEQITLTTEEVEGTASKVSVNYPNLPQDISEGKRILIDDGLIELKVTETTETEVICEVINGGKLGSRKGVNLPGISVKLPAITDKDVADIEFGIEQGVDFIAASFVRKADDVLAIREILEEHNSGIYIIPKIENQEGVENIEGILEVSDGLMVARGDLGVEIPPERVPTAQKMMINRCNEAGKPVITATQMLDSMIRNPRPTRAEASDVANAIHDGTDATMLSGETAAGDYPVEAVKTMARIALETEKSLERNLLGAMNNQEQISTTNSISYATCKTASDLEAAAIITSTRSGYTARMVSKYRPYPPIIAATPSQKILNRLSLSWGVRPVLVNETESTDEMIEESVTAALSSQYIENGDVVVITAGTPVGITGTTNLLKVHTVGEVITQSIGIGKKSASGRVCVVEDAETAEDKIQEQDILVTSVTDEKFTPLLEKCSAVITEEGGLTSHAAIIGLQLEIPVIVGAENIMDKLETGDIVTVDSIRGLVYKGETRVL
ncbi:pyruvate kinase [Natroniella sulfidigena]|uniref:pyruvate kinase n=1 Tax=Natroniella sulfidigena TaxID=723921 RepID=UPI00200A8F3E|nr:pyruvate kinase [Natroniella sulfidigena]MCK8815763.1 pyruvate kinase [Natroniella sulfidigena]